MDFQDLEGVAGVVLDVVALEGNAAHLNDLSDRRLPTGLGPPAEQMCEKPSLFPGERLCTEVLITLNVLITLQGTRNTRLIRFGSFYRSFYRAVSHQQRARFHSNSDALAEGDASVPIVLLWCSVSPGTAPRI